MGRKKKGDNGKEGPTVTTSGRGPKIPCGMQEGASGPIGAIISFFETHHMNDAPCSPRPEMP
jgi:hypothetical protein